MRSPEEEGRELLESVRWQLSLGSRAPGLPGHEALKQALHARLEGSADEVFEQSFTIRLPNGPARCANLIGLFYGTTRSDTFRRAGEAGGRHGGGRGALLLGTHFDTRLQADREEDPARRRRPIPGANDGGSGTAVLLSLLSFLRETVLPRDVLAVFFDAEDVGDIGGLPFACGARFFVSKPPVALPEEAVILDMVGGRELALDIDMYSLEHLPSRELTGRILRLGRALGFPPFRGPEVPGTVSERGKLKYIVCDHLPFIQAGIASCLLIDLDYPPWHTQADLPKAMSGAALTMISEVVKRYVQGP